MIIKMQTWFGVACVLATLVQRDRADQGPVIVDASQINSPNITIVGDQFMINGRPLHILSGSLHYFRLPAAYWRDRLQKLKAAGLNSVCTYVEWNHHEPEERQYLFDGDQDIAQFVRIAAEVGLLVLLRPGPYVCTERDLGGLPYWLLSKYPNIKLRTTDKDFIKETDIWMKKLFEHLSPLLFGNGGPIILVQVENEYGSYSNDKVYMEKVRDIILEHVGTKALLFTTDGTLPSMYMGGSVSGTLTTIDFGTGTNVNTTFESFRKYMPSGPLMNSEFYPGWLTHWGETIQQVSTDRVIQTLKSMLDYQININFYVFFGGSNFEFTSGANHGSYYQPTITSYDFDAPLTEAGDPTPKYFAIRAILEKHNPSLKNIPLSVPSNKGKYGNVTLERVLDLLSLEGREKFGKKYGDVTGAYLPTFEQLRQRSGLMLYESKMPASLGTLTIQKPRDRVYVYVDNELKGIISRMNSAHSVQIIGKTDSTLSLLVENQGRINYGPYLKDFKGILSNVTLDDSVIRGWKVTGFPLQAISSNSVLTQHKVITNSAAGPILFRGSFKLPAGEAPLDTFLDTTGWTKGYVWINGHNLGRYWTNLGPQITLYVPGVWLRPAPELNTIEVLELESSRSDLIMEFIDYPILNRTVYTIKVCNIEIV